MYQPSALIAFGYISVLYMYSWWPRTHFKKFYTVEVNGYSFWLLANSNMQLSAMELQLNEIAIQFELRVNSRR